MAQYRNFELIVYEQEFEPLLKQVQHLNIPHIYILHDKDWNDNGKPDKAHYHLQIYFSSDGNKYSFGQVSDMLCFPDITRIEKIKNKKMALRYLIHKDEINKYDYPKERVKGSKSLLSDFRKAIVDDKNNPVTLIISYLQLQKRITCTEFLLWVEDKDLGKFVYSHWGLTSRLIDEHNHLFVDKILTVDKETGDIMTEQDFEYIKK